mmetsp:Transcript_47558/g.103271  ORF Transcript_47558/g.103271 Transcript_47558/m.103271 type:complete len:135 (+) Transcript_47558:2-406(+)
MTMVWLGLFYGLMVLPVVLSLIGPRSVLPETIKSADPTPMPQRDDKVPDATVVPPPAHSGFPVAQIANPQAIAQPAQPILAPAPHFGQAHEMVPVANLPAISQPQPQPQQRAQPLGAAPLQPVTLPIVVQQPHQ